MFEVRQTFWAHAADSDDPPSEEIRAFATRLADGVAAAVDELDPIISEAAEHWRLERMNVMDRLILRLAVYEFLHEPATPAKVIINEALELARTFSGDEAVRFINGVLDAIRKKLATRMTTVQESDQVVQRRANLDELRALGVDVYPTRFDAHDDRRGDRRRARRPERRRARGGADRHARRPGASSASAASARPTSWCCPTARRACRSTSAQTRCRSATSRSSSCSTSATGSASRDACSGPRPTS